MGAGKYSTTLKCSSDGIKKDSTDGTVSFITIKDMRLRNIDNHASNTERGIDFTGVDYSLIENVRIDFFHTGIFLSRGPSAEACYFNHVTGVDIFYLYMRDSE